ncbi:MAG: 4Fe-4S ferredoxin [Spirulina sp. SIO3F2]|nr:4Fe-4S ferredoxin [Spirulina sp. SIO3F2]
MTNLSHSLNSLQTGTWFKLICGASFQDLPTIRNLVLTYALASVDCIDVAADPAVVRITQAALRIAHQLQPQRPQPWLMVSLNDGIDPHFRKADFDPTQCPVDCPRPCEVICPTAAIALPNGINRDRCYGCGRCWPVCPQGLIQEHAHIYEPRTIIPQVLDLGIAAIEIHTQVGNFEGFKRVWQVLQPHCDRLQLLAISCPDHPELISYLRAIADLISPLPCELVWQTDGRPMSGDLGKGTTHAAVRLAQKVLAAELPGYVQLAGGTNAHTVTKLAEQGLLQHQNPERRAVAGAAYGSYARKLLMPIWQELEQRKTSHLEDQPDLLQRAIALAKNLVQPLKQHSQGVPGSTGLASQNSGLGALTDLPQQDARLKRQRAIVEHPS